MSNKLSHSLLHVYICCSLTYQLWAYLKNGVLVFKTTHCCLFRIHTHESLWLQWVCNWEYHKYTNRCIRMRKISALTGALCA